MVVGEKGVRLVQTGSSREVMGKSKSREVVGLSKSKGLTNLLPMSRRRKVRRRQRIGAARRMQVNIRNRECTLRCEFLDLTIQSVGFHWVSHLECIPEQRLFCPLQNPLKLHKNISNVKDFSRPQFR